MRSIGFGWLADNFDNYKLLATFYGVRGLSLVYLPFSSFDGPIAFAWIFSIHQIGPASAACGAGRTRDIFLTYEPVFVLAGIAYFIATLLLLGLRLTPQSQLDFQS